MKLTKTEKAILILAAVFLLVLAGMYRRTPETADYTVTAQYELDSLEGTK